MDGELEEEHPRRARVRALHCSDKKLPEMSMDEKCAFFDGYRTLGNEFFAEGRYQWAKKTYSEAVTAIQYGIYIGCEGPEGDVIRLGGGPTKPLPEKAAQLLVTLLVNSAQCCLKEGEAKQAHELCDKAEAVDCSIPAALKAKIHSRRGEAKRLMGNIHEAYEELISACRLQPHNRTCRASLDMLKREKKRIALEDLEGVKATWTNILGETYTPRPVDPVPRHRSIPALATAIPYTSPAWRAAARDSGCFGEGSLPGRLGSFGAVRRNSGEMPRRSYSDGELNISTASPSKRATQDWSLVSGRRHHASELLRSRKTDGDDSSSGGDGDAHCALDSSNEGSERASLDGPAWELELSHSMSRDTYSAKRTGRVETRVRKSVSFSSVPLVATNSKGYDHKAAPGKSAISKSASLDKAWSPMARKNKTDWTKHTSFLLEILMLPYYLLHGLWSLIVETLCAIVASFRPIPSEVHEARRKKYDYSTADNLSRLSCEKNWL